MKAWTITNLRSVPQFADTIADRGWNAWWTTSGVSLSQYRAYLDLMLESQSIPLAFVAHSGKTYLGSTLLIASDLDVRQNLSPWIAALWVDPDHRRQGIASELMAAARASVAELGYKVVYLSAEEKVTPYYLARGWRQIEKDVGGLHVFEMEAG